MASTIQAKPKFNKGKKKRGAIRKLRDNDDDDEEDSALTAIQSTQKKQKLAQSTLYKRGLDVNKTLKAEPRKIPDEVKAAADRKTAKVNAADAENALFKTTFSSTENGPSETVMQQKHQSAMEEFINKQMNIENENAEEAQAAEEYTEDGDAPDQGEADMGAGGTMLGGTGIAEVILPVEQRLQTVKQTEELRNSLPMTFGKKTISSAGYQMKQSDVAGVAASFSQNFREPKIETAGTASQNAGGNGESSAIEAAVPKAADDGRVGFQAARHGGQAKETRQNPRHQRSSDDRVLKRFIKKERQNQKR
jgi:hypothetical protein